jgi:hypothetical protein
MIYMLNIKDEYHLNNNGRPLGNIVIYSGIGNKCLIRTRIHKNNLLYKIISWLS